MLLKLQIFLLDFVDCQTDHIDHITEDSCSNNLNQSYNDCLDKVVRREITVSYRHHGSIGPIVRIDVQNIPWFFRKRSFVNPSLTALRAKFCHYVKDQCEKMSHRKSKAKEFNNTKLLPLFALLRIYRQKLKIFTNFSPLHGYTEDRIASNNILEMS
jgi:hypothetical protein